MWTLQGEKRGISVVLGPRLDCTVCVTCLQCPDAPAARAVAEEWPPMLSSACCSSHQPGRSQCLASPKTKWNSPGPCPPEEPVLSWELMFPLYSTHSTQTKFLVAAAALASVEPLQRVNPTAATHRRVRTSSQVGAGPCPIAADPPSKSDPCTGQVGGESKTRQ